MYGKIKKNIYIYVLWKILVWVIGKLDTIKYYNKKINSYSVIYYFFMFCLLYKYYEEKS